MLVISPALMNIYYLKYRRSYANINVISFDHVVD